MSAPSFPDLDGIEVEHLVGLATGLPLVKLRAQGTERGRTIVMVGQIDPAAARDIAAHLTECAARAEYETDFITTARAAGITDDQLGVMLSMIRQGEVHRHTIGDPDGA